MGHLDIPKYEMVKQYVKHLLKDDIIPYGMKLPSEHDLMEKFQVSRQTVRQAFGELAAEGLVYKEQGKGTFSHYKKGARQSQIVAVVTTYLSGFVFPGIISGIEQVLSTALMAEKVPPGPNRASVTSDGGPTDQGLSDLLGDNRGND